MSIELKDSIPVGVMQFRKDEEESFIGTLLGEITENDGDEIEIAFETPFPWRRTYVRFKVRDLRYELEKSQ